MGFINKFYTAILVVLVALCFIFSFMWQYERVNVHERDNTILQLNNKILTDEKERKETAAAIKKVTDKKYADLLAQNKQLEIDYTGKLNELQIKYDRASGDAIRLRKQVSDLNSRISTYTREDLERYAVASSDGLSECIEFTGTLENLALRYYTEREYYKKVNTEQPITITAIDPKTGATIGYGSSVRIKGDIADIEPVVP